MSNRSPLKILHIEDDHFCRDCLRRTIDLWPDVVQAGWAATVREGLQLAQERSPDIVLLELHLPDGNGFDLIEQLSAGLRPPQILILSGFADEATLFRIMYTTAGGLMWKATFSSEVFRFAVREVANGRRYVSPEFQVALRALRCNPSAFFKILSERELELLPLLGRGDSDGEIARIKSVAPLTVKSHRGHIMMKLGLHSSHKLLFWCVEKGFVARRGSP